MHQNLEKRLLELAMAKNRYHLALEAVRSRFALIFTAMAKDAKVTPVELANRFFWNPTKVDGNTIMNGTGQASNEDIAKMLEVWEKNRCRPWKQPPYTEYDK